MEQVQPVNCGRGRREQRGRRAAPAGAPLLAAESGVGVTSEDDVTVKGMVLAAVAGCLVARAEMAAPPEGRCAKYVGEGKGYELMQKVHAVQLRFAFDLHRKWSPKAANRLTSPYSAYAVLAMLAAGARGTTQEELRQVLFGTLPVAEGVEGVAATLAALECRNEYRSTTLVSANRLFVQRGVALVPDFVALLKSSFQSSVGTVDFARAAEAAATINEWVAAETRQKVRDLVPPKALDATTKLVLVNALYVLGTWAQKFDAKQTAKKPFELENGRKVRVPTMQQRQTVPTFTYAKRPAYQALVMEFADRLVDVVWILPKRGTTLARVMELLDVPEWEILEKSLERRAVDLALPRFQIGGGGSLVDALKALGVEEAFRAGKASFEGIDDGKHFLYVGEILQKTVAKVDELGFEGAAATAALMAEASGPPKPATPIPFVVDRPFGFVVLHRQSGAVLFVGEVRDPR